MAFPGPGVLGASLDRAEILLNLVFLTLVTDEYCVSRHWPVLGSGTDPVVHGGSAGGPYTSLCPGME